jgi:hypothetical protein
MPTTSGSEIRTIADIIKTVMKCSDKDADEAELQMCKSPANMAKLLAACGLSTAAVGYGGKLFVAGAATSGVTSVAGIVLGTAGILGAKRFCSAAVKFGTAGIQNGSGQ